MRGTLKYTIQHVVEERLDVSIFDAQYCNDETGRKGESTDKDRAFGVFPWNDLITVVGARML
ncbi:MAG: hypothetical protein SWO11_15220 [Thermodesulfobacteriota bacterium]|nr:hypothetical protein [Thermodesulfobacteriota bacterium]